jgi:hypothetical protein
MTNNRFTCKRVVIFLLLLNVAFSLPLIGSERGGSEKEKIVILWTSGDKEVAMNMVLMYTYNAKKYGWWDDITFVIWGPSAKLVSADKDIRDYIAKMRDDGIKIEACLACTDKYGVTDLLKSMAIDVKYMGKVLTEYVKTGRNILTF